MIEDKITYTTLFLVPILGINEGYLKRFNFINGYLNDVNHEVEYENCIYLVFKPVNLTEFELFVKAEKKRMKNYFVEDYDCGYGFVVIVYKVPDPFLKDYKLFLEGKYSKVSKEFMKLFPEIKSTVDEEGLERVDHSLYFHVFNKSLALRNYWEEKLGIDMEEDSEVLSIPNITKETFDIYKYIKEEQHGNISKSKTSNAESKAATRRKS